MRQKKIFVLLVILAGLAGFYFWYQNDSRVSVSVTITDNGFEPETIQIEKGTEVIFKNIDNQPHWPASDLHPTHGIYPEFDPTQPIEPGKEWSFVFNKIGVWRYHDHLYPRNKGTITVTK